MLAHILNRTIFLVTWAIIQVVHDTEAISGNTTTFLLVGYGELKNPDMILNNTSQVDCAISCSKSRLCSFFSVGSVATAGGLIQASCKFSKGNSSEWMSQPNSVLYTRRA
jgi:hypothetical protein